MIWSASIETAATEQDNQDNQDDYERHRRLLFGSAQGANEQRDPK
jgi:hypothetical protein